MSTSTFAVYECMLHIYKTNNLPLINNATCFTLWFACIPVFQFTKTLVCQGHLCPLPLHVEPVYWAHDNALRLYPLPDLIVCADKYDPFTSTQVNCTVINPVCASITLVCTNINLVCIVGTRVHATIIPVCIINYLSLYCRNAKLSKN